MVLYRKYRPQTFAQIVGQEHVKKSLLQALAANNVGHAYLFYGTRGSGKTSTARILAKALNCEKLAHDQKSTDPCNECSSCIAITNGSHMDVIEIDAASNRGIDDIRELRERVKLSTSQGRKKVYIIDEVHMLTNEAFNALLKTLEEPPDHVVFILATTEIKKVPQTILSRCQRFDFHLASTQELRQALAPIIAAEGITITSEALTAVTELAEGSFRDAIKMLDQLANTGATITPEVIASIYHTPQKTLLVEFLSYFVENTPNKALQFITERSLAGDNLRELTIDVLRLLRVLLYQKAGIQSSEPVAASVTAIGDKLDRKSLVVLLRLFAQAEKDQKVTSLVQLPLELAVMEWAEANNTEPALPVGGYGIPNVEAVKSQKLPTKTNKEDSQDKEKTIPKVTSSEQEDVPPPEEIGAMLAEVSDSIEIASDQEIVEAIVETTVVIESVDRSDGSLVGLRQHWPNFMARMIELNHSLALLLKNAAITDFDGEYLTLEVLYKFHKERLEQDKLRYIVEDTLSEMLNQPIRLRCLIKDRVKSVTVDEDLTDLASQVFGGEVE